MSDETVLQDAIESLRQGDKQRARALLTSLLKDNQKDPVIWVWLSAAVETSKERLYCLQTALQLDPQNEAAKRGLVMLGALPPDDSQQPFPLNLDRPRPWEESLLPVEETDKPRGFKAFAASPLARLVGILGLGAALISAIVILGIGRPKGIQPLRTYTRTPGPSPTFTLTVTSIPSTPRATLNITGPTPLVAFLDATYTPTPIYINTPRPGTEAYKAGLRFYNSGDYKNAIPLFQQVLSTEPDAGDAYYYLGQCYLKQGLNKVALSNFQNGIDRAPNFAPNYLGRARARRAIDAKASVIEDLDTALQLDPNFLEAYLERGAYYLKANKPEDALGDYKAAVAAYPNSALAHLGLAKSQLALGESKLAVTAATQAKDLDITHLETYLVLGQAYTANNQNTQGIEELNIYITYVEDDENAYIALATAQNNAGLHENAIASANQAISLEARSAEAYYQRGVASLGLDDFARANDDFGYAFVLNKNSFAAGMGVGRALLLQEKWGSAYTQIAKLEKLALSNAQKAEFYYYRALALEGLNEQTVALRDWQSILNLPAKDVPTFIRAKALQRVPATSTPTSTATPKITPTP